MPVTADLESGYGKTPEEIADFTKAMVAAGAVGLNFEDITGDDESSHVELPLQVNKIRAIRETAAALSVPVVINARTDIYLMPIGPADTRFERTVERLRAYRDAGADCLFVPGLSHQIRPPPITRPIAINCVPDITPPKTDPRPGSSRRNSRKNRATP